MFEAKVTKTNKNNLLFPFVKVKTLCIFARSFQKKFQQLDKDIFIKI